MAYDPSRASPTVKEPKAQSDITLDALLDEFEVSDPAVRDRVLRLAGVESSGNLNATGPRVNGGMHNGTRARGALQIMPATAKAYPQYDLNDPADASRAGLHYFLDNLNQFGGDLDAATIAHHAGPGTAKKWLREGRAGTVDRATGLSTDDYLLKVAGGKRAEAADNWWESDPVAPAEAAGNWWESDPVEPAEEPGLVSRGLSAIGDLRKSLQQQTNDYEAQQPQQQSLQPSPPQSRATPPNPLDAGSLSGLAAGMGPVNMRTALTQQQGANPMLVSDEELLSNPGAPKALKAEENRREMDAYKGAYLAGYERDAKNLRLEGDDARQFAQQKYDEDFAKGAPTTVRPEASWKDAFNIGATQAGRGMARGFYATLESVGDMVGSAELSQYAGEDRIKQEEAIASSLRTALGKVPEKGFKSIVGDAIPTIISQGAPIAAAALATVATRNPEVGKAIISAGVLAPMGVQSYGNAYADGKQKGLALEDRVTYGVGTALAEVLPERISLGYIMDLLTKPLKAGGKKAAEQSVAKELAKRYFQMQGSELATEEITTVSQFLLDRYYTNPDLTLKDLQEQMIRTALVTPIATTALGAAGAAGTLAGSAINASQSDLASGLQTDQRITDAIARQSLDPSNAQMREVAPPDRVQPPQGFDYRQETANVAPPLDATSYQGPGADPAGGAGLASDGRVGNGGTGDATGAAARSGEPGVSVGEAERQQVAGVVEQKIAEKEAEAIASGDPIEVLVTRAEGASMRRAVTPQPTNGIDIDQDALLADVEAMFTEGGNLMVQGDNAREAVKRIDPKALASALPRGDGALLVPKRFAGPVMDALQGAKQRVSVAFGGDGMMQAPDVAQFRATVPTQEEVQDAPERVEVAAQEEETRGQEGATAERQSSAEGAKESGGFDPVAFDKARNDTIEASRNAGNLHLDQLPNYVEGMRGREIYDVHNPDVRGVIDTVDNNRTVYVIRNDGTRDRLVPSDFKDYVVAPTEKADVKTLRALRKKADDKQSAEREAAAAQERARVNAEYADLVEASRRVRPMLDRAMAGTAAEREIAQAFVDGQIDVEDFIAEMGVNGTAVAPSGNSDASSAEPAPAQTQAADKPKRQPPARKPDPVTVERAQRNAEDLRAMAQDAGWAEEGGRLIRDAEDNVSRTKWIPRAEWFMAGMEARPDVLAQHIEAAARGEWIPVKSARTIEGMVEWLDTQRGQATLDEDASMYDFEASFGNVLDSPDAREVAEFFDDTFGDFAEQSEADAMRALGFTEEEIANAGGQTQAGAGSAETTDDRGTAEPGERAGEAGAAQEEAGQGQREGLTLDAYTNADIARREAEQTARAEADARAEREAAAKQRQAEERAEVRRRSEAAADTFDLGMDPMENLTGQGGLRFSRKQNNDAEYLAAVERGDMEAAQRMVDQAARDAGYVSDTEYRMQHRAPNRESDVSLVDLRDADLVPSDYWTKPEWYQGTPEEMSAWRSVTAAMRRMDARKADGKNPGMVAITVYRAVPKGVKDGAVRNGDWVTPSREYAVNEGQMIPGGYRIIAQQALMRNLFWDGNSIAELGYDDGQPYAYRNTKNNRKLLEAVTYDDDGNVIPLSKRFNARSDDARFSFAGQNARTTPALTRESLVQSIATRFPSLSRAVESALRRGDEGKAGGVVVVERAEDLAGMFASKTGRSMDDAVQSLGSTDGRDVNGLFDSRSGLTFLVAPNLTERTAPAVLLHEATHGKQRAEIDRKAMDLIETRQARSKPLRDFLFRVEQRMEAAGESGNVTEAAAYIVEEAVVAGRQAGFSAVDGKLMNWIDLKFGRRVSDIVRDFVAMIRAWAMRAGVELNPTVDDLVAIAQMNVRDMARGDVTGGEGAKESRASQTSSMAFRDWFGDSNVVDENGQPLVMYHGSPTPDALTEFQPGGGVGSRLSGDAYGVASYFTSSPGEASTYARDEGGAVLPVYLRGEILDLNGELTDDQRERLTRLANETLLPSDKARFEAGRKRRSFESREDAIEFFDSQRANWSSFGDGMDRARPDAIVEGGRFVVEYTDFDAEVTIETADQAATLFKAIGWDNIPAAGFDGVMMVRSGGAKWVVMHQPDGNVKSATGNNGDFDPADRRINFSRASQATMSAPATAAQPAQTARQATTANAAPPAATGFDLPRWTKADTTQERIQDRYNRLRDAVKAVAAQGGVVTDMNNFDWGEDRFHGVASNRIEQLGEKVKGILENVKASDVSLDEVVLYAYAEHAPERNAAMQAINPNVKTGSGMSDAEAKSIIDKAKQEGTDAKLARLAESIRQVARDTLQFQLDSGLITQAEFDAYNAKYQKWVPLRGFETLDEDGRTFRGTGKGFNIRGSENLRALGRDSKAGQVFENIMLDAERAIVRGTKNTEVNHRFLQFIIDNPDESLWEIDAQKTKQGFKNGRVTLESLVDKGDGTIGVKVKGHVIYMKIHDKKLFEQMANHWNDIEFGAIPYIGAFNRYLSKSYTAWSPEFALYTNPMRDLQAALFSITGREGIGMTARFAKNYPRAVLAAYRGEAMPNIPGVKAAKDPLYEEYKAMGGKTGFWNLSTLESKAKEIETLVKEMESLTIKNSWRVPVRAAKALERLITGHAGALENATRLASYMAMREAGHSKAEAARFAKNLNVNFNRRGTWTAGLGSIFLFFNPAVQGAHNMYETLAHGKHKGQAWALIGAGMAGMAGLAVLNAMAGDDDDGIPYWDKIPQYEKERNIIIVLPPFARGIGQMIPDSKGRYLKIPMPYQWNVPMYASTLAVDVYRNSENAAHGIKPGSAAARLAVSGATSFMPITGLPPTIAPIYQHTANKSGFGDGPLYPETPWNKHKPDSEKYSAAMHDTGWQKWASFVNAATGGSRFKEGLISMPPSAWRNYVRAYLGGPMSFLSGSYDALAEEDITRAPFLRKAYGEIGFRQDQSKFYEVADQAVPTYKAYMDALKVDPKSAKAMRESSAIMIDVGRATEMYMSQLGATYKQDKRTKDSTRMTEAEKRMQLKITEQKRSDIHERYLKMWREKVEKAAAQ